MTRNRQDKGEASSPSRRWLHAQAVEDGNKFLVRSWRTTGAYKTPGFRRISPAEPVPTLQSFWTTRILDGPNLPPSPWHRTEMKKLGTEAWMDHLSAWATRDRRIFVFWWSRRRSSGRITGCKTSPESSRRDTMPFPWFVGSLWRFGEGMLCLPSLHSFQADLASYWSANAIPGSSIALLL